MECLIKIFSFKYENSPNGSYVIIKKIVSRITPGNKVTCSFKRR